jgi:hypothetical protein
MPFCFASSNTAGKRTHLKFKRQHIHPRGPALAAFGDDFLDKQPPDGQVDRADDHEPPAALAVEEGGVGQRLGAVGFEDEVAEFLLFLRQGGSLFLPAESPGDIQIRLTLVAAEVQDFKGAERFAGCL